MQSKSTVELADLRNTLNARNSEIVNGLKADFRKANEEEARELAENKAKITEIEAEISIRNSKKNNAKVIMSENKKRLSLSRIIRSAVTGEELPEEYQGFLNEGKEQVRGLYTAGNSVAIPTKRANTPVTTTVAANAIETDLLDIVAPVYDELVLTKLGVRKLTGLKGNVQVPTATATTADWATETGTSAESVPTFGKETLTPNRLTTTMYVSLEMLQQDTLDVDVLLRNMMIEPISQKLEETILGSANKVANTKPGGIFYGATSQAITTANIFAITTAAKKSNIKNAKWLINPDVESTLKSTFLGGTKSDIKAIYDAREAMLDGAPVIVSNKAAGYAIGDFSSAILGQWGGITLTPTMKAREGQIEMVVNSWWDFVVPVASRIKAYTVPTAG